MSRAPDTWILTADCPSLLGTVDAVTRYLFEHRCYVTEHHSFDDQRSARFPKWRSYRGAAIASKPAPTEAQAGSYLRFDVQPVLRCCILQP